jgi:hypothetical protein
MAYEFDDIELYRNKMIGRTVVDVQLANYDEGLILTFNDGSQLKFGFCGCEGTIEII